MPRRADVPDGSTEGAARAVLDVVGMDCASCERNLEFALETVAGVVGAKADHRAGSLLVVFDPAVTGDAAIRRVVEDIGYGVSS